ncbi:hypothetical protein WMF04_28760 [Sorangium sp. So ce260]|uniref:hypothetical protein n=1 Tax=Sorangium sp. So ce260 TaxID=3133291 RepID=UPI003F64606F
MITDPIVDEVRAIRDSIAKEHDYDIDSIFESFRRLRGAGERSAVPPAVRQSPDEHESASAEGAVEQDGVAETAARHR